MTTTTYKQTEIGAIPSDWIVKSLGEVFDLSAGGDVDKTAFSLEKDDVHIYPIFANALVDEGFYGWSSKYTIEDEAITITGRGDVGKVFYRRGQFTPIVRLITGITKDKNNSTQFLSYMCSQIEFANESTGVPQLTVPQVKNYQIPLPPTLAEQEAIAGVLSDMDALLAALDKLIAKKKQIKIGAMQKLLSPQKDWETKKLGEIGSTYGGLTGKSKADFGNGNSFYIPFLNILNNPIIDKSNFEKVNVKPNENQNAVRKGDLFFNTSSETPEDVGTCSVLLDEVENVYLNSFCFGFRIADEQVDGLFLSYFFRSKTGREIMTALAQGATRYNLSKSLFNSTSITLPKSKAEQERIASILSDMDAEIAALERKREKYRQIKAGAMQQLLTGKVRLLSTNQ